MLKQDEMLCFSLGVAMRRISKIYAVALAEHDITPPQLFLLTTLGKSDGLRGCELAQQVCLDSSSLPGLIDRGTELLGGAAVPCALFALGGSLAGYPLVGDVGPSLYLTALKLVLHPLLVWVVAVPFLGLSGLWVSVAVTMAAMPAGLNVYLFGARYEAAEGVAARTVFLTTLLSVGTISVLLMLMGS